MGPRDEAKGIRDGVLYLNGEPIALGQIPEIKLAETGAPAPENFELRQLANSSMSFTVHIKISKYWRCGSRKRFIKLLMSKRISRNMVESVARVARIAGVSYEELWQSYFFWG